MIKPRWRLRVCLIAARPARALLMALPLALAFTPEAHAGSTISPILIEFPARQSATIVSLTNTGTDPVSYELRVLAWSQVGDKDDQTPTNDIILSPPVTTVPGGATQLVRLVLRNVPRVREHAYRLIITELPTPGAGRVSVAVSLRSSMPVLVAPMAGPPGKLIWRMETGADGNSVFVATNTGSRTVRPGTLTATAEGGKPVTLVPRGQLPGVQPGAERRWDAKGVKFGSPVTLAYSNMGTNVTEMLSP